MEAINISPVEIGEEEVKITDTEFGDVIRYNTSRKLYLVSELTTNGNVQQRLLHSATQKYRSTINNFTVIRVIQGKGGLTEQIAEQIDCLVKSKFYITEKRNIDFPKLYNDEIKKTEKLSPNK